MSEEIIKGELDNFLAWGRCGFVGNPRFEDPIHARLVDVTVCLRGECPSGDSHQHAQPVEFAILLRQIIRRIKIGFRKDVSAQLPNGVDDIILASVGIISVPINGGLLRLTAKPWKPTWLGADSTSGAVDDAALSPLKINARARFLGDSVSIQADPVFKEATGYESYRSPGQLASTRSALSTEPGSTLIVQLPTGGGKTDVAIAVLKSEILDSKRTNVFVVPTIALALDLERRFRQIIGEVWGYAEQVQGMPLIWTGDTPSDQRQLIRDRISTGDQPILITSPEVLALDTGVGASLEIAAANDLVGWLIVDEAHIIKQWGQEFRPDFLDIVLLRNKLKRCAEDNGFKPLRTLLLSATYTPETLEYLVEKFDDDSPIHLCAANELRPEIDIWTDVSKGKDERKKKFLEAIHYLPRPLIIYATKPEEANTWVELLKADGFTRSAAFSGKTVGADRKEILQKFRNDLGCASEFDIVVATSAFGLGVDYDQVRSVVHVCLPETVDRWYQEIGRGGRDGYKSVAVALTCKEDQKVASGMGVSVLTTKVAWKRFQTIMANLRIGTERDPSWRYLDLHENMFHVAKGSYNRRWNKQLLRGLVDLGIMEQKITWRRDIPQEDREKLENLQGDDDVRSEIIRVKILKHVSKVDFQKIWDEWKNAERTKQDISLQHFMDVLSGKFSVCEMLAGVYMDSELLSKKFGDHAVETLKVTADCGQCPSCRRGELVFLSSPVPSPVNGWSSEICRTIGDRKVMVKCTQTEVTDCLQALANSMPIHLIDMTQARQYAMATAKWVDFSPDFLLATPALPLVIVHEGELDSLKNQITKRIYLAPAMPVFLIGPSSKPFEPFETETYETLMFSLIQIES